MRMLPVPSIQVVREFLFIPFIWQTLKNMTQFNSKSQWSPLWKTNERKKKPI